MYLCGHKYIFVFNKIRLDRMKINYATMMVDITILLIALYLTIYFDNGKWMWFCALLLLTGSLKYDEEN